MLGLDQFGDRNNGKKQDIFSRTDRHETTQSRRIAFTDIFGTRVVKEQRKPAVCRRSASRPAIAGEKVWGTGHYASLVCCDEFFLQDSAAGEGNYFYGDYYLHRETSTKGHTEHQTSLPSLPKEKRFVPSTKWREINSILSPPREG